jgi:peptidoglycan L-alanyl-D-glutamate endopeptidase CwlK
MSKLHHEEKLRGLDKQLLAVVLAAMPKLNFDCTVAEGVRSTEQAFINYGKGRTAQQLVAIGVPGRYAEPDMPKVTWVSSPLATKHLTGHAVDIYPLLADGTLDTGKSKLKMKQFDALYHAMMCASAEVGVRIRYGGDWDEDGQLREKGETDSPHFELS